VSRVAVGKKGIRGLDIGPSVPSRFNASNSYPNISPNTSVHQLDSFASEP
jgi:hypothetical protein